jgi:GntR family transcriptional regulator/MocR family aminotransferase
MSEQGRGADKRDGLVAMLSVALDRGVEEPLVRQLYRALRELILTQRLAAGAKLPSTRALCRDLGVSRTVTLDAFSQLAAEGFLESRRGAGHFIAALPFRSADGEQSAALVDSADRDPSVWSEAGRPFDPAWQAADLFPGQVWTRMLGRGWRRHQPDVLQRHWGGLPALREALAQHLHALRGTALSPAEVMITAGNSEVTALMARAFGRSGLVWVEDPGLGTTRQVFGREGMEVIPIPVDSEGLVVAEGEKQRPGAALAIVTPTRQFPLGMPLSLPRRLALLNWARQSGAIIVDDDYDGEIRFTGRPLRSLASLDPGARVITLGSLSKLTFSGLRLGYAAGPADLIARLIECRRESFTLVPTSAQAAFAEFIGTGAFARHLRALRTQLTRRRKLLVETLQSEADDLVEILPQEVGMHLTVRLRPKLAERWSDVALAERGRAARLTLLPLSPQYVRADAEQGFLLGYAGWPEAEMRPAINELTALLRTAARK